MDRFLFDTSAILEILSGSGEGKRAAAIVRSGEVATSVIAYCEVVNKADVDKLAKAEAFLKKLLVFYLGQAELETARDIELACRKKGRQVPTLDALIAATAMNTRSTLVSADRDFERIEGLKRIIL